MPENATLEFLDAQMACMFARVDSLQHGVFVADGDRSVSENVIASVRTDIRDMLAQMSAIVAQHHRFSDRLQWLKEHPAQ
jgi:hypothetical protein